MENLILLHKIDVQGKTKSTADKVVSEYIAIHRGLFDDNEELNVTNIFLPTCEVSDVKVLYPLPNIINEDQKNLHKINNVIDAINDLVDNRDKIITE